MLNPPLSLLSDDLLDFIVEHLAKHPFRIEDLKNLSLTDRAFTQSCQNYIFWELEVNNYHFPNISKQLAKKKKFLDDKPSFANRVRVVNLAISRDEGSVFKDPNFISILQLFAKSPMPPYKLRLGGGFPSHLCEGPMLVVRQFSDSFFSQTLTILHITYISNGPLPLFLICPRLREVLLDHVGVTDESYDKYPDNQCSNREAPLLEVFKYRSSHSLVKYMITPPPRFNSPVVLWSNLRVLTLAPRDGEGMACLQPILDAACNTLEELHITSLFGGEFELELPIAGLVNLSNLRNLRVFFITIAFDFKQGRKRRAQQSAPPSNVLHDFNIVLGTIPDSNRVTNLRFILDMTDRRPYRATRDQDWVGMFNEVIRIGGGKPLELELAMKLLEVTGALETEHPGQHELFKWIMEKAASLSDYPKICTHWWDPTLLRHGMYIFRTGHVRGRCSTRQ